MSKTSKVADTSRESPIFESPEPSAPSDPDPPRSPRPERISSYVSPARPRDTFIALAGVALVVLAGAVAVATFARPVTRVEGVGQPVSALRWVDDTRLEIGTVGEGVAIWDASSGTLQAEVDAFRADSTVLSLPDIPPVTPFPLRPAVVLRATALPGVPADNLTLMQRMLETEGRLSLLDFRGDIGDPAIPLRFISRNLAIGTEAMLRDRLTAGLRTQIQWLSTGDGTDLAQNIIYDLASERAPITAMLASVDGAIAIVGDENGRLMAADLQPLSSASGGSSTLDVFDFGLADGVGDGPGQASAVVALATAGSGDGLRVAAAAADGRIVVLRAVDAAGQSPETLPLRTLTATEAGLLSPELWVEPVASTPPQGVGDASALLPLGFSRDRSALTFYDQARDRLVQVEVGGTAQAELPLDRGDTAVLPDPRGLSEVLSDLPLLQGESLLALLNVPSAPQTFSDAVSGSQPVLEVGKTLSDVLSWRLPVGILRGTTTSPVTDPASRGSIGTPGSARDPDTGRVVLWGSRGQIIVLTPGVEDQGEDLGDGRLVADAAFEPGTGALVVLFADGTARRWVPGAGRPADLAFASPAVPGGDPSVQALALSFPPGEMVTLVHWSRTATAPGVLRRYDRATAAPLGPGLEVGFEDFILPDRSNLMITNVDGQEILLRDARTGGTVLNATFEGGSVQLTPSNDGRDLGIVVRDMAVWTLRVDPTGEGTPPEIAAELSYLPVGPVAVPLPVGGATDGLSLSADGGTLLVRTRDGRLYASGRGDILNLGPDQACCVALRPILPGVVALRAVLTGDGSQALVAGADHMLWQVEVDLGEVSPLVQLAGPVRDMALSPDGTQLAVAAEGADPVVIDLGPAKWLAQLPLIGHAPYVVPEPLAARAVPAGVGDAFAAIDTLVFASFSRPGDAVALRDALRGLWPEALILQDGALYMVTADLAEDEMRDLRTLRQALLRARAAAPAARGASLGTLSALCPVQVQAPADTPVNSYCLPLIGESNGPPLLSAE